MKFSWCSLVVQEIIQVLAHQGPIRWQIPFLDLIGADHAVLFQGLNIPEGVAYGNSQVLRPFTVSLRWSRFLGSLPHKLSAIHALVADSQTV